ncbi:dipeptidyl aminopeptidase/acylaminoacyl peptidase [Aciduliprofundum sp. MAR08-339]|uniref:S9 family peptidase n=1 Tax=Aciduliprofundum sp. (strain MAR08-339) TaxID=673860 RepID=UPI0002A4AA5C|nr:dipeptidyl aminopeptidase/acylaminoacyl peptidase [Aciduliprofundum sp. MAR08-339]
MRWKEDSFTRFSYLQDVSITRDGTLVAYVLRKANMKENKYENTVVIETLLEGGRKYVEDATMPKFSPDGKKMLYLRVDEDKKKSDLYLLDLDSMTSKRLIEAKNIVGVDWHRESRKILILYSKKLEDEDLYYDDSIPVWFNGKGFRDGEKNVIQIYDTEGEVAIEEFEDRYVENAMWFGDEIIYTVSRRENPFKSFDIIAYRGKKKKIFENVSFHPVATNGKQILMLGKRKMDHISEHSYLLIYDGKEVREITSRYGLENFSGKLDSSGNVYALTADAGSVVLEKFENGERERIVGSGWYVYSFDVSDDGKIAILMMSDTRLGELYIYDGKLKKYTSYNDEILKKLRPRKHVHFTYESFDGKKLDGWYIKPRGAGKRKMPAILFVHGGPKGMYGYYFHYNAQLMADRGFYVIFTNPRGSTGYSEDFALEVLNRTGLEDFQDILAGLDWVIEHESIDEGKVGITGISYGGYMTNWAVTQSDRFKAAISENGISYWLSSYAFSDIGLWFDREVIGEDPLSNDNYRKLSPLFYAESVNTPILLIHSLEDYRCPLDQSLMFYHVLKSLGKEAYIVIFKQGEHGHSVRGKPRHRLKRYRIFVDFFVKKIKEEKEFKIEPLLK